MKSFYPIHLQKIERLAGIYNLENTRQAIELATRYRNFNANAVERILQQKHPLRAADPPPTSLWLSRPPHQLDDIDSGSLGDYDRLTRGDPLPDEHQTHDAPPKHQHPDDEDHDDDAPQTAPIPSP